MADEDLAQDIVDENSTATPDNIISLDSAATELTGEDKEQPTEHAQEEPQKSPEGDESSQEDDVDLLLGDESADTEAESDDSEEGLVEVTIDGETTQVPLDELRRGYSREADYTRKTKDLASQREVFQKEQETAQQEIETQRQQAQAYVELVSQLGPPPQLPDPELIDRNSEKYDPEEYNALRASYEVEKGKWDQAAGELDKQAKQKQEQQNTEYQTYLAEQNRKLQEAWPDVADDQKRPKIQAQMKAFLKERGFSDEDQSLMTRHELLLLARDAYKWTVTQANKSIAKEKVRQASPVQRPGTKRSESEAQAERKAVMINNADKAGGMTLDQAANWLAE